MGLYKLTRREQLGVVYMLLPFAGCSQDGRTLLRAAKQPRNEASTRLAGRPDTRCQCAHTEHSEFSFKL